MPRESLSDRQLECLDLAAEGLTSKQIAIRLGISHHTVDQHIKAAMSALDVRTRAAAIALIRRAPPSPKLASQAPELSEPRNSVSFGSRNGVSVEAEAIANRVQETRWRFDHDLSAAVPEIDRPAGARSVSATLTLIVLLAVLIPILLIGIVVLANEAYRLPFG